MFEFFCDFFGHVVRYELLVLDAVLLVKVELVEDVLNVPFFAKLEIPENFLFQLKRHRCFS